MVGLMTPSVVLARFRIVIRSKSYSVLFDSTFFGIRIRFIIFIWELRTVTRSLALYREQVLKARIF